MVKSRVKHCLYPNLLCFSKWGFPFQSHSCFPRLMKWICFLIIIEIMNANIQMPVKFTYFEYEWHSTWHTLPSKYCMCVNGNHQYLCSFVKSIINLKIYIFTVFVEHYFSPPRCQKWIVTSFQTFRCVQVSWTRQPFIFYGDAIILYLIWNREWSFQFDSSAQPRRRWQFTWSWLQNHRIGPKWAFYWYKN